MGESRPRAARGKWAQKGRTGRRSCSLRSSCGYRDARNRRCSPALALHHHIPLHALHFGSWGRCFGSAANGSTSPDYLLDRPQGTMLVIQRAAARYHLPCMSELTSSSVTHNYNAFRPRYSYGKPLSARQTSTTNPNGNDLDRSEPPYHACGAPHIEPFRHTPQAIHPPVPSPPIRRPIKHQGWRKVLLQHLAHLRLSAHIGRGASRLHEVEHPELWGPCLAQRQPSGTRPFLSNRLRLGARVVAHF